MEKTPLELYETAYRLHYTENRVAEAVRYYEILIKEFPDSNECGYAAIQIQKIKAGNLAKQLRTAPRSSHPLAFAALFLSLAALVGVGGTYYLLNRVIKQEHRRTTLTISALGKMYRGEDDEALKILAELKIVAKDDITPFELSADIYRKKRQYEQAHAEYELFYRLNPDRQATEGEKSIMLQDEKRISRSQKANTRSPSPAPVATPPEESKAAPRADISKPVRAKKPVPKKQESSPENKPIKGLFLVDPDSISYF